MQHGLGIAGRLLDPLEHQIAGRLEGEPVVRGRHRGIGRIAGILALLREGRLVALETNEELYRYLLSAISDPRFHLLHESATEVDSVLKRLGLPQADYIISGIPFKTIPEYLKGEIVRKTHAALKPKGEFLVYQLSGAVRPYLERVFGAVRHDFELLSIPPGRMFYCER